MNALRHAIQHVELHLKRFYQLEPKLSAAQFLVGKPVRTLSPSTTVGTRSYEGALFIRQASPQDLEIAIYIKPRLQRALRNFSRWRGLWNTEQVHAFSVLAEEVSHFHFLLFHVQSGRPVSQLELEVQGEIDKFLLAFFSQYSQSGPALFDRTYRQLFEDYSLGDSLSPEQQTRYLDANNIAKNKIRKLRHALIRRDSEGLLPQLRKIYREPAFLKLGEGL